MTSGIYTIRCMVTDKVYVGASCNIPRRWKEHRKMLKEGNHHSKKLQEAWNDYGAQSFEFCIVEEVLDQSLCVVERQYIDQLNSESDGYNATDKSLENLNRKGTVTPYGTKKTREVSVSEEGWAGSKALAKKLGCSGVSELLEKIGRGEINLS